MGEITPNPPGQLKQASSDEQLIALWLYGKAQTTKNAYQYEAQRFLDAAKLPLNGVTLGDIQAHLESLAHLSPATQARAANALKSLFSFAHRLGYIRWNVAAPIKAPKIKNTLAERILSEGEVKAMLSAEADPANRAMLRLLYAGALRISELCALKWRDLQGRGDSGQITVFGKGGKTGAILLPAAIWLDLQALEGDRSPDKPVFPARSGATLNRSQAWRIVKRAARRVGLEASPHWLRHCHASHALDRGASIALVQQTLRHSSVATTSKYLHVRPNESSGGFLAI